MVSKSIQSGNLAIAETIGTIISVRCLAMFALRRLTLIEFNQKTEKMGHNLFLLYRERPLYCMSDHYNYSWELYICSVGPLHLF